MTYADGSWEAPDAFLEKLEIAYSEDEDAEMSQFGVTSDQYGTLTLASLIGASYDDPRWDALLSQMSEDETWNLVRRSGYLSQGISSIAMPQVTLKDGTAGISSTLTGGGVSCTAFPTEVLLASTFDTDLAETMGKLVGEDSLSSDVAVWYAPAANIHRCAYSGRNFEYYSEDPLISGRMCAAEVTGARSKGTVVTVKHFALNDQETNRIGGAMLADEQAIREIYLMPFELAVRDGGADGMMDAMSRIGPTWAGGHAGLLTQVLRDEWGFKGFVTTDQASFTTFNMCDIREGLGAGTDMWLNVTEFMWQLPEEERTATVMSQARQAAHRILYAYANSNAMNGVSSDARVVSTLPSWLPLWIAANVLLVLFLYVWHKLASLCFGKRTLWQTLRHKPKRGGLSGKKHPAPAHMG